VVGLLLVALVVFARLPCFFVICPYLKLSLSPRLSLSVLVATLVCSSLREGLCDPTFHVCFLVSVASLFKGEQLLV
jgi:flagellar biosynthesis protein FliR